MPPMFSPRAPLDVAGLIFNENETEARAVFLTKMRTSQDQTKHHSSTDR